MKVPLILIICIAKILANPENELVAGNRQFAAKLYRELLKQKPNENFLYAPFGIQTILSMLSSAAQNENHKTITQIKTVAGLPATQSSREEIFKNIISEMNRYDDDFKIFHANKMYFATGYSAHPYYQTIARQVYQSEVEIVNFQQSQNAVDIINSWVAKKTNNKLPNFLESGDITKNTKNVLVNALYVLGKWDKPFDATENEMKPFYKFGTQPTRTEMMKISKSFDYGEDAYAKYLKMEMVREGGGAYMVFVLPHERGGLVDLENNVANVMKMENYASAKVDVLMPKFKMASSVHLKDKLQRMGITNLFKWGVELKGLIYPGQPYTIIKDVFQRAVIDVNEYGVEAAAATEAEVGVDDTTEHRVFIADHPFLFQIVVDDVILFAGRVVDPQ